MSSDDADFDVLVVGYGPVGATLGCLLGQFGRRVLVVDRAENICPHPRAISLDHEALRILQLAGLPSGSFPTRPIERVRLHCPIVGQFAELDTSGTTDGHSKLATFHQPSLEYALRQVIASHPSVTVTTGVEATAFEDLGDAVLVTLRGAGGGANSLRPVRGGGRWCPVHGSRCRSAKTSRATPTPRSGSSSTLATSQGRSTTSSSSAIRLARLPTSSHRRAAPDGSSCCGPGRRGPRWSVKRPSVSCSHPGTPKGSPSWSASRCTDFTPARALPTARGTCSSRAMRPTSPLRSPARASSPVCATR